MHICFVTYQKQPSFSADDQLLVDYLIQKNIEVSPAVWDNANVDWTAFDVIVMRSMWDYHTKISQFNLWLDKLEQLGCKVLNPIDVVRRNQNKNYLVNLAQKGVQVPPFQFCKQNGDDNLSEIMRINQWEKAVVKPAVSGGAFNTWKTGDFDGDEVKFSRMQAEGDVIVQQFMEEIATLGELSLMFFNKQFSYAVIKNAKPGDFRVQHEHGGSAEAMNPDEKIINYARKLLENIPVPLLYARVDGIPLSVDKFYLMELELIEPALFIRTSEQACENFYNALLGCIEMLR